MNLVELLVRQACERPGAPAVIDAHRTVTFAELEQESCWCAASLAADGLQPGDVVLVFCPMGVPLYVTLLAIFRLGLVAMFVDPSSGRAHLDRCCDIIRPKAFLGTWRSHLFRLVSRPVRSIPVQRLIRTEGVRARSDGASLAVESCDGSAPALITFTTGSAGEPKAAVRTHGFLLAQHRAVSEALDLTAGQVDLTTLPMFVLANLASGVTSVIADADLRRPGSVDPVPILRQIRHHRPTRTVASPAFLERLASHCLSRGETLDVFTRMFTGGGPVFPPLLDRLAAVAPHAEISAVYGSTEAEPIAIVERREIGIHDRQATRQGRGLLAGRPVSDVRVGILPDRWRDPLPPFSTDAFERTLLPAGEAGEIVVTGEHVLGGYLHGRGDGENKFSVAGRRWHRTGDAGYFDRSGRLWLLGRSSAALDDARGKLYPFQVEAAAEECQGVERAALVACEGRRVLAVTVSREDRKRVRAGLEQALEWVSLDEIRIVRRIPVDPRHNAKIDYQRLRAQLAC